MQLHSCKQYTRKLAQFSNFSLYFAYKATHTNTNCVFLCLFITIKAISATEGDRNAKKMESFVVNDSLYLSKAHSFYSIYVVWYVNILYELIQWLLKKLYFHVESALTHNPKKVETQSGIFLKLAWNAKASFTSFGQFHSQIEHNVIKTQLVL